MLHVSPLGSRVTLFFMSLDINFFSAEADSGGRMDKGDRKEREPDARGNSTSVAILIIADPSRASKNKETISNTASLLPASVVASS